MSSCDIINVCFKTKSVIPSTKKVNSYQWSCFNCDTKHTHMIGAKGNTKSIAITFDSEEFRLCPKCIKQMNDKMEEE